MRNNNTPVTRYFLGFAIDKLLVIGSIITIAIATLYPFNFSIPQNFSVGEIFASFDNTSFFNDQVNNVLLFMPLGFGLASIFQRIKVKALLQIPLVIIAGASLSFSVEFLQAFLPSRSPTPADILNNAIGAFVGLGCFYICDSHSFLKIIGSIENSYFSNSSKKTIILLVGYILLTFGIGMSWQNNISLSEWNANFPLILGNETTGNRPWQGYISQISFADEVVSDIQIQRILANQNYLFKNQDLLIANYDFNGKNNYRDKTGKLPDLLWQGELPKLENSDTVKGVILTSNSWLKSADSAKFVNQKISKKSRFTVITTVASANSNQTGPARIISLSGDSLHRNLTIGQEKQNLQLRLRTPITGQNGSDININVPNVFSDTDSHQIVITYSKAIVNVYVDRYDNVYRFNLLDLLPNNQKVFSYAITFLPLGLCLALLSIISKRKFHLNRLILIIGILLPSLIVESILIHLNDKNLSLINLAFGIFFTACTALFLQVRTALLSKNELING
ncbi:MAG: VanZ family protein [Calothrix sp. CSU_2_0]|nr:VanZ family protein [Calothrix sp. CSU_2_0]